MRAALAPILGAGMLLAAGLAGLAGHGAVGFGLVALGVIAGRLWSRPWLLSHASQPDRRAWLVREIAGQVLLVGVVFAVGVVLARGLGWQPAVPVWLPPVLILACAAAMRWLCGPEMRPAADAFLSEATAAIEAASVKGPQGDPEAALLEVTAALDGLPEEGARHHEILAALNLGLATAEPEALRHMLYARIMARTVERDLRALAIAHTDPWIARHFAGQRDLDEIFAMIAEADAPIALSCFRGGAEAVLDSVPEASHDMPDPDRLRAFAASQPPPAAQDFHQLANRVEALRQEAPRP